MSTNPTVIDLVKKMHIVKDEAELQQFFDKIKPDAVTGPVRIAFVNAHAFNLADKASKQTPEEDAKKGNFLKDLLACDYVLRDGDGMRRLFDMLERDPGLNLNGTDLIPRIMDLYRGKDVALLGTTEEYLDKAGEVIAAESGVKPSLKIDGFKNDQAYVDGLKAKPAPVTVLAMGMPKQERVSKKIADNNDAPNLIICGGAILDFKGGKVQRAPQIFIKHNKEWVWRLMSEPRRMFSRYVIGNAVFLKRAKELAADAKEGKNDLLGNPSPGKPDFLCIRNPGTQEEPFKVMNSLKAMGREFGKVSLVDADKM
ncbi:MAG: hypothetical protein DI551_10825, partial [Micavibrio aeruginosavorus]